MSSLDRFKTRISEGHPVFGVVLLTPETAVAELVVQAGFDFAWIDMEHSTLSFRDVESLVVALENQGCVSLVRAPQNEPNCIGKVLDAGADIVNVPHIATPQQAEQVVRSAKYYPMGRRGFSSSSRSNRYGVDPLNGDRMQEANAKNMVMVQIESRQGMENLDGIARTEGVDILFLGLGDLSQDLGIPGQFRHDKMADSIERFSRAVSEAGKIGGVPAMDTDMMSHCIGLGLRIISCAADIALLREALRHLRERIRTEVES